MEAVEMQEVFAGAGDVLPVGIRQQLVALDTVGRA
jgi:hypothetical protein